MSERHHWILSSFRENDVSIYDSLSSLPLTASVEQQLLQVYGATMPHESNGLLVSSVPVQQQRGECDCGLFVIATALHIGAGNNTEEVSFDQTKMRSHLVQCFEKKTLSPFPQTRKKVKRSMLANILIPVYCQCSRPDSLDEMIQCDGCDAWFHFQCAHIKRAPDSDWFCSNCTK